MSEKAAMDLSNLRPPAGSTRRRKRVGRGPGSGHGKTSTRGHKGQFSRSGAKRRYAREGGQMPLHRRLPKRGFWNPFRVEYQVVNLSDLAESGLTERIDIDGMRRLRLVRSKTKPVKVLGNGEIGRAVVVQAHAFSQAAEEKIAAAGGRCEKLMLEAPATGPAKS
ncbi:MAG: 50S ribosomal protein L15 [Candidatus Zixiibacteriota bacterium]